MIVITQAHLDSFNAVVKQHTVRRIDHLLLAVQTTKRITDKDGARWKKIMEEFDAANPPPVLVQQPTTPFTVPPNVVFVEEDSPRTFLPGLISCSVSVRWRSDGTVLVYGNGSGSSYEIARGIAYQALANQLIALYVK